MEKKNYRLEAHQTLCTYSLDASLRICNATNPEEF